MVDSIKNQTNQSQSQTVQKDASNTTLRESFKQLSSGLSVSNALRDAPAIVHVQNARGSGHVGKIVNNLNDAVKSSKDALKSLEDLAASFGSEGNADVSKAFASDVQKLKSDIGDLVDTLRQRAGTAEVMNENMQAADVKLEDVYKAQAKAQSMHSIVRLDKEQAMNAHQGLTLDRVQQLLAD